MSVVPIAREDPRLNAFRTLPHNVDAEKAVLGAIFANNQAYDSVSGFLCAEHFALDQNGRIYGACAHLIERGKIADPVTLKGLFEQDAALAEIGGTEYLSELAGAAVGLINAREYAHLIRDLYFKRELIAMGDEAIESAYGDTDRDASEIWFAAEAKIEAAGLVDTTPEPDADTLAHLEKIYQNPGQLLGVPTGFIALDNLLSGFQPGQLILVAGRPSMGKAQPNDAHVLLETGEWRKMVDLAVGDRLASVDGQRSAVMGVYPQGEKEIYNITMSDGRTARACADHLWVVNSSKFKKPRTLTTREICEKLTRVRYYRRLSLPLCSGNFGAHAKHIIPPYLMGALLGDGCFRSGLLHLTTRDDDLLRRCSNLLLPGYQLKHVTRDDYRLVKARRGGGNIYRDELRRLGLWEKHSHQKHIPADYFAGSYDDRLDLLRGLLDTDGWAEKFGAVRFATTSKLLAQGVATLARSLGGACSISQKWPTYSHKGEKRNGRAAFTCNITHPDRASLFHLNRKKVRCRKSARFRAPTIVSVKRGGVEQAICIQVSHPSGLYITEGYTVTHNTTLAVAMTRKGGARSLFLSLEQSRREIELKMISDLASVPLEVMRRGNYRDPAQFERVVHAGNQIRGLPMEISGRSGMSPQEIRAAARRHKKAHGLDILFIDQLTHISPPDRRTTNRVHQIGEILKMLKSLARELNVPLVLLHQLSRAVEGRENKRPTLADLRDSGEIEQDADVVMFVFRETYYLERDEPADPNPEEYENGTTDRDFEKAVKARQSWERAMKRRQGMAEIIIGKQRMGPIDAVTLHYDGRYSRFGDLGREQ